MCFKERAWFLCWSPRGPQVSHQRRIWGIHCTQARKHATEVPPWLWNQGQTLLIVQSTVISGPTKRAHYRHLNGNYLQGWKRGVDFLFLRLRGFWCHWGFAFSYVLYFNFCSNSYKYISNIKRKSISSLKINHCSSLYPQVLLNLVDHHSVNRVFFEFWLEFSWIHLDEYNVHTVALSVESVTLSVWSVTLHEKWN